MQIRRSCIGLLATTVTLTLKEYVPNQYENMHVAEALRFQVNRMRNGQLSRLHIESGYLKHCMLFAGTLGCATSQSVCYDTIYLSWFSSLQIQATCCAEACSTSAGAWQAKEATALEFKCQYTNGCTVRKSDAHALVCLWRRQRLWYKNMYQISTKT